MVASGVGESGLTRLNSLPRGVSVGQDGALGDVYVDVDKSVKDFFAVYKLDEMRMIDAGVSGQVARGESEPRSWVKIS